MKLVDFLVVSACTLGIGTLTIASGRGWAIAHPWPFIISQQDISQQDISQQDISQQDDAFAEELLEAHNRYREDVGVSPLEWSSSLAESAQDWADELASANRFAHSDTDYGENLWKGTAGRFSLTEMVEGWGDEEQYFIPNQPFPNVSSTGNWMDVGHYTQIVWEDTTEVGCAIATGHGWDVLVCHYSLPGNFIGEQPF